MAFRRGLVGRSSLGAGAALAIACVIVSACSLLVDTKGLADGPTDDARAGEEATIDADSQAPPADATTTPDTADGTTPLPALVENFDGPLDSTKWGSDTRPTYTLTVDNGALHITNTSVVSGFAYIQSKQRFDARGKVVIVNLVSAGAAAANGGDEAIVWTKLIADADGGNAVEIGAFEGGLYAKKFVAGDETTTKTIPFDATKMTWLRIEEAAGTTSYAHAAAGDGPWTVFHTEATPVSLASVVLELGAGGFPGRVGDVTFDNVRAF